MFKLPSIVFFHYRNIPMMRKVLRLPDSNQSKYNVFMCVFIYVCMQVYIHCLYAFVCACVCVHVFYACVSMLPCMHACICVYVVFMYEAAVPLL